MSNGYRLLIKTFGEEDEKKSNFSSVSTTWSEAPGEW